MMFLLKKTPITIMILSLILLASCGKAPDAPLSAPAEQSNEALNQEIHIKGTDSMTGLLSHLAEKYQTTHPEAIISVEGGGTAEGLAAVINEVAEIAAVDREMTPLEANQFESLRGRSIKKIIAYDGISVVVNRYNITISLSLLQLADIFQEGGRITQWNQASTRTGKRVGGNINIYLCPGEFDLASAFKEQVLKGKEFRKSAIPVATPKELLEKLSQDQNGIGLISMGLIDPKLVNVIEIGTGSDTVAPTIDFIRNGRYSLVHPLRLYTPEEDAELTKDFFSFIAGPKGEAILVEHGLVPYTINKPQE